ncbi:toxin [Alcaligenaceae bacterium B3P038]|nr:toxin [Alcaligenaceae bacterium B3P038]
MRAATSDDRWVADGNYSAVRDALWPRATHVVWLNYSRRVVFMRVLRRTLHRGLTRSKLSHGNRESLLTAFFSKDSILWWSYSTFRKNQHKYAALRRDPAYAHLEWTELNRPSQAKAFIAKQRRAPAGPICLRRKFGARRAHYVQLALAALGRGSQTGLHVVV